MLGTITDGRPRPVPGRYGYSRGWQMTREGVGIATVYERKDRPDFVVATGEDSGLVAGALRRLAPGHTVPRADVCEDFAGGQAFFRRTHELVTEQLRGRVVLTDFIQTGPKGEAATLYVGAKTSETRVRMYEKGKEDPTYPADTVRLEVQVRPGKPHRKAYAGSLAPEGFWGFSRWSRWLLEEVTGMQAPAAPARSRRLTDLEGSIEALAHQYGGRLIELIDFLDGDLEAFALYLLTRSQEAHGGD